MSYPSPIKLNMDKTQFIWLRTRWMGLKGRVMLQICENRQCRHYILHWSHLPWVVFDQERTFLVHFRHLLAKCFHHLHQPHLVRRMLTDDAADTGTCIYYKLHWLLYSVFSHASSIHIHPLQSVLHSAARLIACQRKYDSTKSTIRDNLHWLPIPQMIEFKLFTLCKNVFIEWRQLTSHRHAYLSQQTRSDHNSLGSALWTVDSSLEEGDIWHPQFLCFCTINLGVREYEQTFGQFVTD